MQVGSRLRDDRQAVATPRAAAHLADGGELAREGPDRAVDVVSRVHHRSRSRIARGIRRLRQIRWSEVGEAGLRGAGERLPRRLAQLGVVVVRGGEDAIEVRLGRHELEDPREQLLLDAARSRDRRRGCAWRRSSG